MAILDYPLYGSPLRRIIIPHQAVRLESWQGDTQAGHDPNGEVLGILGMGGIGAEVVKRARACGIFGMQIQYHIYSPLPKSEARYVGLDELLRTSDVLSLNVPHSSSTQHIISKPQLEKMKGGIVIVYTSRGKIIDKGSRPGRVKCIQQGWTCMMERRRYIKIC